MKGRLLKAVIDFKLSKDEGPICSVYRLYNPRFPHIFYVGSSKDVRHRLNSHLRKLDKKPSNHKNFKLVRLNAQFPNELCWELIQTYSGDGAEEAARDCEQTIISFPPKGAKLLNIDKKVYSYKRRK